MCRGNPAQNSEAGGKCSQSGGSQPGKKIAEFEMIVTMLEKCCIELENNLGNKNKQVTVSTRHGNAYKAELVFLKSRMLKARVEHANMRRSLSDDIVNDC